MVDYTQSYKPEKEKQLRLPRIVTPTFPFPNSSLSSPKKSQTWGCCSELLESENQKDRLQSDEKNEEADYDIINLDFISENENRREEEEEEEAEGKRKEEEERKREEENEEKRRREEKEKREEDETRTEVGGMKLEVWMEEGEGKMESMSREDEGRKKDVRKEEESFDVTVDKRELRCFTFEKIEEKNESEFDDTTTYNGENFEDATKKLDSLINSLSNSCIPSQPKKKKLTLKSTSFMREELGGLVGGRRDEGGREEEGRREEGEGRKEVWRSLPSLNSPFSPFEPYESPFCSADAKIQNFFKFNVGPPSPVKEVKEAKKEITDPTTYVNPNFLIGENLLTFV